MNMVTKHEVLQANLKEWLACKGDKKKRGELTSRFAKLLSIHKKSVGRSMKRLQMKDSAVSEKRGRSVYYGKDVDVALFKIWEEMEYPCAENMHSVIKDYVTHFTNANDWNFSNETTSKLCAMSIGTLKLRIMGDNGVSHLFTFFMFMIQ